MSFCFRFNRKLSVWCLLGTSFVWIRSRWRCLHTQWTIGRMEHLRLSFSSMRSAAFSYYYYRCCCYESSQGNTVAAGQLALPASFCFKANDEVYFKEFELSVCSEWGDEQNSALESPHLCSSFSSFSHHLLQIFVLFMFLFVVQVFSTSLMQTTLTKTCCPFVHTCSWELEHCFHWLGLFGHCLVESENELALMFGCVLWPLLLLSLFRLWWWPCDCWFCNSYTWDW